MRTVAASPSFLNASKGRYFLSNEHADLTANRALARKLFAASTELLAAARDLERKGSQNASTPLPSTFQFDANDGSFAEVARQAYHARRLRSSFFPADLFGEPAWDILLDLFIATYERRAVSVSSLCLAAAVPSTTALRYIKRLEDRGVLVRDEDPEDSRRTFVRLSAEGFSRMLDYLRRTFPTLTAPDWTIRSD